MGSGIMIDDKYKKPWHVLKIDIESALRPGLRLQQFYENSEFFGKGMGVWDFGKKTNYGLDRLFSDTWLGKMEDLGIPVNSSLLFYRKPYLIYPEAHIDVFSDKAIALYAINWVPDIDDDSEMVWYDIPAGIGGDSKIIGNTKTPYVSWPLDQVEHYEFSRKCLGPTPTLVSTGTPHNVIVRERERWSISIRLRYHDGKVLNNWQEVVDFYQKFIIHD